MRASAYGLTSALALTGCVAARACTYVPAPPPVIATSLPPPAVPGRQPAPARTSTRASYCSAGSGRGDGVLPGLPGYIPPMHPIPVIPATTPTRTPTRSSRVPSGSASDSADGAELPSRAAASRQQQDRYRRPQEKRRRDEYDDVDHSGRIGPDDTPQATHLGWFSPLQRVCRHASGTSANPASCRVTCA